MNSGKESFLSFILPLALLVFLVFGFKWSILDANNIPTGSMIPTLKIGDYLFVNKMRYSFRIPYTNIELFRYDDPERGDIVTFVPPATADTGKNYVKRVVAVPGDVVRVRNVPACDLMKLMNSPGSSPMGNLNDGDDPLVNMALTNKPGERDYECGQFYPARGKYGEPVVVMIEYRKNGEGPWIHYMLEEYSAEKGRELLQDSDNVKVLHPDLIPTDMRPEHPLPVVFKEDVGGESHFIVETSFPAEPYPDAICPEIFTSGCFIPEDYYMVLGDNRDDSRDSRYIGLVPRKDILGKALVIYFSINWRDQICERYSRDFYDSRGAEKGYLLDDFPPEDQFRYCSQLDASAGYEGIPAYIKRSILYRIPRLDVRWSRIGKILK